jgi:hypothetical protein
MAEGCRCFRWLNEERGGDMADMVVLGAFCHGVMKKSKCSQSKEEEKGEKERTI